LSFHKTVYGGVPPVVETVIEPSLPPKHVTLEVTEITGVTAVGWVTVPVAVPVQPLPSVTVTLYVPTDNPPTLAVPCPVPGAGDQKYVYDGTPPDCVAVAVPLFPPKHETFEVIEIDGVTADGWVTVPEPI